MPGRRGGAYSDGKALQQDCTRFCIKVSFKVIETFQQMKEGHQAEVLEALHQEEPGKNHFTTVLDTWVEND